ncbi:MAG: hypothetical protein JJT93_14700, partial [Gammaproteobacteria bacterium]|nr:hypothetical protein [Gammaproteobacteria bacterium]
DPLRRVAQRAALDGLLDLAAHDDTPAEVRAIAEARLSALLLQLERNRQPRRGEPATEADRAHLALARRDITAYFEGERDASRRPRPAPVPLPWP